MASSPWACPFRGAQLVWCESHEPVFGTTGHVQLSSPWAVGLSSLPVADPMWQCPRAVDVVLEEENLLTCHLGD